MPIAFRISSPIPGIPNTDSTTTEPPSSDPNWRPRIVTTGTMAFLIAWRLTTDGRHDRELQRDRQGVQDHLGGREAGAPTDAQVAGQQAAQILEVLDVDRLIEPEERPQ